MKSKTTRLLIAAALAAGSLSVVSPSLSQDLKKPGGFPDRPLTIIVPYGVGGGADVMSRAWAEPLSKITGVEVRVVNQPGGGGYAALPDYMSRPADGFTILEHDDSLPPGELLGKVSFKVFDELEPVCVTNVAFSQIYIRTDEKRFHDWPSFLKYAKENPGQIKMGNVGLEMVQVNLLEDVAGIKVNQINFDKPAERNGSLVGGHVDALYEQPGDVMAFLESKQVKPILTFLPGKRLEAFPDAPTLTETGLDKVTVMSLIRMFWIHKATPADRKAYLQQACEKAYNSESFQQFLKSKLLHFAPSYMDAKTSTEKMKVQMEVYRDYFKKSGQIK